MLPVSLQIGRDYLFGYPRHNFHGVASALEWRRVRVTAIRDLVESPLDPLTTTIQPLVKRGRYLVTGLDLDKNVERSFYLDSMVNLQELELVAA